MTPTTESAGSDSTPATEQAQEKVKEGAQAAKEQAQNATAQAQARAREQVDQRSTEAGERLKGSAGDARSMAEHLRSEGKDGPAKLVDQAAERAEGLGSYLADADTDQILRDVEDYARKNPWAVIAGGIALGFAASRVVSASTATRSVSAGTERRPALTPPAADTPRAAADAAVGDPYLDAGGLANADLPNYGGSPQ